MSIPTPRPPRVGTPVGGFVLSAAILVALPGLASALEIPPASPEPRTRVARRHAELARRRLHPAGAPALPEATVASGVDLRPISVTVTSGNGVAWLQPGETATIAVTLRNFGNQLATGVFGELSSLEGSPYVTVTDKTSDWPNIPARELAAPSFGAAFEVSVSNVIPCGYPVALSLRLAANGFVKDVPLTLDMERPFNYQVATGSFRFYDQQDVLVYGADNFDDFGAALAPGDLDADGTEDLVVGAPGADGPADLVNDMGEAWVLYGHRKGQAPVVALDDQAVPGNAHVVFGSQLQSTLGTAVAVGDVDGDGFDDLVVAAPLDDSALSDIGAVYIRYGPLAAGGSSSTSISVAIVGGQDSDKLGTSLAVGDVNGDGFDDVIIGATEWDWNEAGAVFVFYGSPARLSTQVHPEVTTTWGPHYVGKVQGPYLSNDRLGQSVGAGDVDGDGIDDLILGAPLGDSTTFGTPDVGVVWLVYGRSEHLPAVNGIDVANPASHAGFTVRSVSGADGLDALGGSVGAADVNGDGYEDLVAGAPGADGPSGSAPRTSAGEAWVVYGQAAPLAPVELIVPPAQGVSVIYGDDGQGSDAGGKLGQSIASGDVNGDGLDDLLLGAPGDSIVDRGAAWMVSGRPSLLPSAIDVLAPPSFVKKYPGGTLAGFAGTAVAALDVDADGFDEVFLGGPDDEPTPGNQKGIATGFSGVAHRTYWHKDLSASYAFIAASTSLPALACDDCSTSLPIGFTFPFYGEKFTTVHVSSNGFLSFVPIDDAGSAVPRCIWSKSPSSQSSLPLVVAPLWDDLDLRAGGGVYYLLDGTAPNRRLTVEWRDVPHYGAAGTARFEVSLYESSGQIVAQYADVSFGNASYDAGAAAVVGVQNRTGAQGTGYSCRDAILAPGLALGFNPNTPLFEDNMESIATGSGKPGKWTISGAGSHWRSWDAGCVPYFHGRVSSFYTGDGTCTYASPLVDARLATPTIATFPPDGRLSLWQRFETFDGSDTGRIDVWNGTAATNLATFSGTVAGGGWHVPGTGGSFFPGVSSASFWFELDTNASGTDLGWMVDDVRVVGCNASGISALADARAFASPAVYCRDGVGTGRLDAVGSRCGDGSDPVAYQWLEDGLPIPGAASVAYTIPATHPAGVFTFAVVVTCAAGSATSAGQRIELVAPPEPVGSSLVLQKENAGSDVRLRWSDVGGADEYVVFQDPDAGGAFATETGRAPGGFVGLTTPMPSESLLFFRVAGANPACGTGPR